MSKLNTADLLGQFKDMSLVELTEFVKAFETEFDVTAAAPVAVAAPVEVVAEAPVAEAAPEAPVAQDAAPEVVAEAAPAAESTEN
jgi:large subunit ribosomal protein L7/L12